MAVIVKKLVSESAARTNKSNVDTARVLPVGICASDGGPILWQDRVTNSRAKPRWGDRIGHASKLSNRWRAVNHRLE
jgi:hypothetical protein